MDPWVETHLRLAERQGLLQSRHLSPLQSYALVLLRFLDARDRGKALADNVKAAMIATGKVSVKDLYPEWFPDTEVEEDSPEAEGAAYDYSAVQWKTGGDAFSEYEALMSQVQQSGNITITAEDTGGEWV